VAADADALIDGVLLLAKRRNAFSREDRLE
jgi:hypothetical protein